MNVVLWLKNLCVKKINIEEDVETLYQTSDTPASMINTRFNLEGNNKVMMTQIDMDDTVIGGMIQHLGKQVYSKPKWWDA